MFIAHVFDAKGWTTEQYDQLIRMMDLGGHSAPGVLYNWAAQTSEGVRVVDVYKDRETADRLAQEKIGPIIQQLGFPCQRLASLKYIPLCNPRCNRANYFSRNLKSPWPTPGNFLF